MRTTLDIPEALLEEARTAAGLQSKTDTIILALRELVRRRRLKELKHLLGRVQLDIDLAESRRRPGRPRVRRP
jgi:Arc/MetJ family transcription regulator